jgi:hypothetical protein
MLPSRHVEPVVPANQLACRCQRHVWSVTFVKAVYSLTEVVFHTFSQSPTCFGCVVKIVCSFKMLRDKVRHIYPHLVVYPTDADIWRLCGKETQLVEGNRSATKNEL